MSVNAAVDRELEDGFVTWFTETGMERVEWIFNRGETHDYDEINFLDPGDYLEILNPDGTIAFAGEIEQEPFYGFAGGLYVFWIQRGFKPEVWAELFLRQPDARARLAKKKPAKGDE